MKEYRIITNSKEYRIQVREFPQVWQTLELRQDGQWKPFSFDCIEAARFYVYKRMQEQLKESPEEWIVVE